MQNSLIDQGLTLMLTGMGTVFVFLTLLVVAITLMAGIVRRLQPVSTDASDEEVAAISAAIAQHRRRLTQ